MLCPVVGCPAIGSLSSCTAKEIQTTQVSAIVTSPGGACEADGNVNVTITATYAANANRYDLGLFVAADGGTLDTRPNLNPTAQSCIGEYGSIPPFSNLDPLNATGFMDTCGDVPSGQTITSTFDVRVKCTAIVNGDLPIQSCRFWKQPGANDYCTGLPGPSSGTGSKCDCSAFHTHVELAPYLKLVKIVDNSHSGGSATSADWQMSATGSQLLFTDSGASTTFHQAVAGVQYSLSENPSPGTGFVTDGIWSCNAGTFVSPNKITLAARSKCNLQYHKPGNCISHSCNSGS